MPFGTRIRSVKNQTLQGTLLGILVHDALREMYLNKLLPAQMPRELEKLTRQLPPNTRIELPVTVPIELQNWLVDTWERTGEFSDSRIEGFARELVKLRPRHPDPDPLAAYAENTSHDLPPSTYLS